MIHEIDALQVAAGGKGTGKSKAKGKDKDNDEDKKQEEKDEKKAERDREVIRENAAQQAREAIVSQGGVLPGGRKKKAGAKETLQKLESMAKASSASARSQQQLAEAVSSMAPFNLDTATWDSVKKALQLKSQHIRALQLAGFAAVQHIRAASVAQLKHIFSNAGALDVAKLLTRWLKQRCAVELPATDEDDEDWKRAHPPQPADFFAEAAPAAEAPALV